MPSSCAAAAAFVSAVSCVAAGSVWPGAQIAVERIAFSPARRARSMCALAPTSVGCSTESSAAPTSMRGPPAQAAGTNDSAASADSSARAPFMTRPEDSPGLGWT